jgi:peptidylprolyl isomerase
MLNLLIAGIVLTAVAEKPEVKLGEPVVLDVTLENKGPENWEGPALALDKRSLTITVGEGAGQFVYQRKLDEAPGTKALAAGEKASAKVEFTPIRAGKLPLEVVYAGKASAEVAVDVKPTGGSNEIGARLDTNKGPITVRFLPEVAPNTAAHFADLVRKGFYDGLLFHRVIQGFMAQGGDPRGTGEGGPGYTLPREFSKDKRFSHTYGRLSMARTPDPDSAGSQFFICFEDATFLDGAYTVFAEVIDGKDAVEKIEAAGQKKGEPGFHNGVPPHEELRIKKATLVPVPPRG